MTKVIILTISIVIVGAIVAAVIWKNPLTPTVKTRDLETAIVEIGTVIKTVPAKGIVEPENEVLLLSPASAIIINIKNGVGSKVNKGDIILFPFNCVGTTTAVANKLYRKYIGIDISNEYC